MPCLRIHQRRLKKRVDKFNPFYYNIIVKREVNKMKTKRNENGTTTFYNLRDKELNRNLRKLGHKVITDKKKQASKNACRKG